MKKRLVAIFLVLLLSIESFAAVVSDNDGSAFITKAEFDSLKNNFQSQIDQYNTSIDSKIDGAIASYLDGIKVSKVRALVDMVAPAKNNSEYNVRFMQWRTPQGTRDVVDADGGFYATWLVGVSVYEKKSPSQVGRIFGNAQFTNRLAYNSAINYIRYTDYTGVANNFNSAYYFVVFPFAVKDDVNYRSSGDVENFTLLDILRHRCHFTLTNSGAGWWADSQPRNEAYFVKPSATIMTDYTSNVATKNTPGSFSSNPFAGAALGITDWMTTKYVSHLWSIYNSSDSSNNSFLNYCLSGNITGNSYFVDYDYRDYYTSDSVIDVPIQGERPYASTAAMGGNHPGHWFSLHYYDVDGNIHDLQNEYPDLKYYDNTYEFRWKWNSQKKYALNWNHLTNSYYNGVFGQPYYKYQGIPVCRTPNDVGKLKMKLQFDSSKHSGTVPAYTYQIMDCPFPNGAMPTTLKTGGKEHVLKRETIPSTTGSNLTTVSIEIEKGEIFDKANGDYIYIKIEPSNADQIVGVEVLGSTIEYISE